MEKKGFKIKGPARPPSPARAAALASLLKSGDARAPGMDAMLRVKALSPEDQGLARELTYGVLRTRRALEHVLARFVGKPFDQTAPGAHLALLLGIYQSLWMERIPAHAIVDETVRLVAVQKAGGKLSGLANAVMRRVTEKGESLRRAECVPWPVRLSFPDEMVRILDECLPAGETEAFCGASNVATPLCLRWRGDVEEGLKSTRLQVFQLDGDARIAKGAVAQSCIKIEGRGMAPERLVGFAEGRFAVEDEGAQWAVATATDGLEPRRILDLCASPGGKTAALADRFPEAEIVATDVSRKKLERLRENLERLGLRQRVGVGLVQDLLRDPGEPFDLVLVDAPCSGLGTIRRHPEIRYRRNRAGIEELAKTQFTLLNQAAALTAPDGHLVYSLCTITRAEGEEVVDHFLAANESFEPAMPERNGAEAEVIGGGKLWRVLTHRHGCDSFAVSRMKRTGS